MKKVISFNQPTLVSECQKLFELAKNYEPHIIIAVATGGVFIAKEMRLDEFYIIKSSRNNKKQKSNNFLKRIIKIQPRWINNILRNIENSIQLSKLDNVERNVDISVDVQLKLKSLTTNGRILIIDDAVDSGSSLMQIINEIKNINSNLDIKSAAIVVTDTNRVRHMPDFYLYENVLIRFPWALDA